MLHLRDHQLAVSACDGYDVPNAAGDHLCHVCAAGRPTVLCQKPCSDLLDRSRKAPQTAVCRRMVYVCRRLPSVMLRVCLSSHAADVRCPQ
jgi:hypothetical protein